MNAPTLFQAALDADDAWNAAGQRLFGKRWGDVRYTPQAHGEPGTPLRALYDAYTLARDAWHAAGRPLDRGYRCVAEPEPEPEYEHCPSCDCAKPVGKTCPNPACRAGVNATPENVARWDAEEAGRKAQRERDAYYADLRRQSFSGAWRA